MRRTILLAVLLALPAAATGQDAAPRPTGTRLLDALPQQADLVVGVPDFPELCKALTSAGMGDAAVWRKAFDEQFRVWGSGLPGGEKLVAGGGALLAAADGEVLLAGIDLKLPSASAPSVRAGLFAMRSTANEKTLRAAVDAIVEGGLRYRYEGRAAVEDIAGRRVLALPGTSSTLYICVQDGFLAASDHPLALGLFFRGLAKEPAAAPANRPSGASLRLIARHGRGDSAWEGWIWGEGESLTWHAETKATASLPNSNAPTSVFALATDKVTDVPVSPVPLDDAWLSNITAYKPTDSTVVGIFAERNAAGRSQAAGPKTEAAGAAWRLGWLRALSSGRIETAFAGIEMNLLRAPFESAAKLAGERAGEFIEWKSDEAGNLTGPIGHGPATFLALRVLHDIGRGVAPRPGPVRPPAPSRDAAPLPAPTETQK